MDIADVKPARAARLLFQLPAGCRVYRLLEPKQNWDWKDAILNKMSYLLELMVWQKSNEGVRKSKQTAQPEFVLPDFMIDHKPDPNLEQHDTQDIDLILSKPRV